MKKKAKFQMWLTVKYFIDSVNPLNQKTVGHRFSAATERAVREKFKKYKWTPDNTFVLEDEGKSITPDRREKFLQWLLVITEKVREAPYFVFEHLEEHRLNWTYAELQNFFFHWNEGFSLKYICNLLNRE